MTASIGKILLSGLMQAVFVMAPLVYPLLLVWLRTAHSSPT